MPRSGAQRAVGQPWVAGTEDHIGSEVRIQLGFDAFGCRRY